MQNMYDHLVLVCGIVLALVSAKAIPAEGVGRTFGYSPGARLTMWTMTLPQVAATLAATLVAYETYNSLGERLLDGRMLNAVLVLMVTTSILGPLLTERFAPRMLKEMPPS
jgi:Kef-type K+ transport system membrane component KefB